MAKKAIKEFELEHNLVITSLSDKQADEVVEQKKFDEMIEAEDAGVIRYAAERADWLKENGHAVNRQNLADGDLKAKEV